MDKEIKKNDLILALDISTACIGVTLMINDETNAPKIVKITHVVPKVSSKIKGMESLILKKDIFEKDFLSNLKNAGITHVIIEEPLLSSNNVVTVSTLLRFNGMISESIYRILGIIPEYISSYDARKYSFPELISIRKYNKKGEPYSLSHIKKALKENHVVLFGSYPYDIDKKTVMMNLVCDKYTDIEWIFNKKGELRKENFDACDSLVCALAFINLKKYGKGIFEIVNYDIKENENEVVIDYKIKIWDEIFDKSIILPNMALKKKKVMLNNRCSLF